MKKLISLLLLLLVTVFAVTSCELISGIVDLPGIVDPDDGPEQPEKSEGPEQPEKSEGPEQPEQPEQPETPEQPEQPEQPETPEQPELYCVRVKYNAAALAELIGKGDRGDVVSGAEMVLDKNVSVSFGKGSSNTEPALYDGAIRIYQGGGTLTVMAKGDVSLSEIIITTADSRDGSGELTVANGSAPIANSGILTINVDENATSVTVTVAGTDKTDRLYVSEIEVVYYCAEDDLPESGTTPEQPSQPDDPVPPDDGYSHTDFTEADKATYNEYIGLVIPFLSTDDYYIEAYNEDGYKGVYYSALCDTDMAFAYYRALYSDYSYDGSVVDDYGDTWYQYSKGEVYVDICYYEYEGACYVDVDAYIEVESGGGTGSTNPPVDPPQDDGSGVLDVDFTDATNVKDVTDQGYYLDGCPTTGSPAVLVIPVDFSDAKASDKGYSIDKIVNSFVKDGVNDYYSVYDYYYISSYGQLELDITVVNEWFRPQYASSYYAEQTMDYFGEQAFIGDQLILDEALQYLDGVLGMDLSEFDSDNNGIIDAVVLINTLEVDYDVTFNWAYRYWNIYTDSEEYYYEYDGVSANDYMWASYGFLEEGYDSFGNPIYNNTEATNPYTYIHEFGHILGADDYYDTAGIGSPMGDYDVMDGMSGDHNAYTKFNYGWITTSRLITTSGSITLTLEDFSKGGDTIILANNWSEALGAYQEYFVVVYYTNNGLNSGDAGYFDEEGILVYHVNAALSSETYGDEIYYDIANNNTDPSDEYGTEDNLIEYVTTSQGEYVYGVGSTLGSVICDSGERLDYTFRVESLTDDAATITFARIAA